MQLVYSYDEVAADRAQLRQLINERRRELIASARVAGTSGRWCTGCGGNISRYNERCLQCRTRRNKRGLRARQGRKQMAA